MEEFRQKEIKNIKKLLYFILAIFVLIDLGINGYLLYQNYADFKFDMAENLKKLALPLVALQILILLFFTLPLLFLYKKISDFIAVLKNFDSESLMIYKKYTECCYRFYARVPEFIFFKNELRIAKFFSFETIPYTNMISLKATSVKYPRGGTIYLITIETFSNNYKIKTSNPDNSTFAMEQILIKNPIVFIRN